MAVSVFVNFPGSAADADALRAAFVGGPLPSLTSTPGLNFIETYQPVPEEIPAFSDGPGAPLLAEINLDSQDAAARLLAAPIIREVVDCGRLHAGQAAPATVDVFTPVHYSLPEHPEPPPRVARLSFVVRYYRPVADEQAFNDFYTTHHPPLLARFPAIRNVLCYLPLAIDLPDGLRSSGAFLGNEVVFDDVAALNHALSSEVLESVKADGRRFASFGRNTHHAMQREAVWCAND